VRVDPSDVNRVFATFAGYQTGNIWRSIDGGTTWTGLGSQLPAVSVYDVAINPADPRLIYAATEVGLFASEDSGGSWWPTNQGPANVAVQELFWMGPVLVAVTHGRGMFWIDLSGVSVVASAAPAAPAAAAPAAGIAAPAEVVPTEVVPTDPANPR